MYMILCIWSYYVYGLIMYMVLLLLFPQVFVY